MNTLTNNKFHEIRLKDTIVDDTKNNHDWSAAGDGSRDGTDWIAIFKT